MLIQLKTTSFHGNGVRTTHHITYSYHLLHKNNTFTLLAIALVGEVELHYHVFLTSALDAMDW